MSPGCDGVCRSRWRLGRLRGPSLTGVFAGGRRGRRRVRCRGAFAVGEGVPLPRAWRCALAAAARAAATSRGEGGVLEEGLAAAGGLLGGGRDDVRLGLGLGWNLGTGVSVCACAHGCENELKG